MTVGRDIKVVRGKKNSKVAIALTYTQEKNVCNVYKEIFQLIGWVNLIISDDHSLSYNVAGSGHSTLAGSFKNEKNFVIISFAEGCLSQTTCLWPSSCYR